MVIKQGTTTVIKGKRINNLYIIDIIVQNAHENNKAQAVGYVAKANVNENKLWHECLGHIKKNC